MTSQREEAHNAARYVLFAGRLAHRAVDPFLACLWDVPSLAMGKPAPGCQTLKAVLQGETRQRRLQCMRARYRTCDLDRRLCCPYVPSHHAPNRSARPRLYLLAPSTADTDTVWQSTDLRGKAELFIAAAQKSVQLIFAASALLCLFGPINMVMDQGAAPILSLAIMAYAVMKADMDIAFGPALVFAALSMAIILFGPEVALAPRGIKAQDAEKKQK